MSEIDIEPQRRLHPLSWLFALVGFVKQFLVPLAALIFFNARDDGSLWGTAFVVPLLVAALWRQMSFRYGFAAGSLLIREGWLFRNVRRIEYRRIENIDTERGVLHRLLGVAEVRLESSTGGKAEGSMRVLSLDAVQELRERIFDERSSASSTVAAHVVEPSQVLLRMSPAELLRYGLIDNRGVVIIAAFVGLLYQSKAFVLSQDAVENFYRSHWGGWAAVGTSAVALAVGGIFLVLVFTRILSIAWAMVTLYDFTLTRQREADLRVSYGLLTRVALTLRLPRVQAVQQTQSILHRLFDRVALSVDLAGGGYDPQEQRGNDTNKRVRWLAPLCTPDRAAAIIHAALPMLDQNVEPEWRPLSARARGRIFRRTLFVLTVAGGIPSVLLVEYGAPLLLLLPIPLAWLHATTYTDHARWALTREALLFRSGWLTRSLTVVPRNRVQAVKVAISPFDSRQCMGALIADTAGASGMSGPLRIPYLDIETALRLAQALYRIETEHPEAPRQA